ncbi:hypothetical protein CVT24_004098 [Panaeolus cyanescens]|uniref:DNA primase n=1 Tax=Panaeolus cyanescens TaxID=181874 RepID=A0A409Y619_9AGAR|nr:hypothetical protein CVT24_004098 [Panaeolus cyanescens]
MLTYYRRLFPFKSLYTWLNHGHTSTRKFTHREFAFTLPGDVYLRYHSFNSAEELKKQVLQFNPSRFEIGPIYSARPRDKKTVRGAEFYPMQRELVFDIDMTDYDPIRTCCSEANICKRCWAFISAAVRVLDAAIREEFGYSKLVWIYSGRRGIHLWISDKEAMELTDEQRKALVGWLTVVPGGKESSKRLNIHNSSGRLAPGLQSALDYLKTIFVELVLRNQDCFRTEEGYEKLLQCIPDSSVVSALREKWEDNPSRSSEKKWSDLSAYKSQRNVLHAMEDIIIQYTYPRIDAEVSKHRNHLLKAPFCVHPKTGRVCVPLDPESLLNFDPESVPTVGQLLQELDSIPRTDDQAKEFHSDWEKTSLKPYVDILDKHSSRIMEDVRTEKRKMDMSW